MICWKDAVVSMHPSSQGEENCRRQKQVLRFAGEGEEEECPTVTGGRRTLNLSMDSIDSCAGVGLLFFGGGSDEVNYILFYGRVVLFPLLEGITKSASIVHQ